MGSLQLQATFDTIIEVFLFLDKSGSGKLNKNDMVKALNEASPTERSPARITMSRFSTSSSILLGSFFCSCIFQKMHITPLHWFFYYRRNGLGQEWKGQFQRIPLCFHPLGWNRHRWGNAAYKKSLKYWTAVIKWNQHNTCVYISETFNYVIQSFYFFYQLFHVLAHLNFFFPNGIWTILWTTVVFFMIFYFLESVSPVLVNKAMCASW